MKKFVMFGLGAMLALGVSVVSTYFTGQAQVAENTIRSGVVAVSAEPTSSALSIDSLAPGVTSVRTLSVANSGSLPADIVVTGAKKAGITEFHNALQVRVLHESLQLYEGPLSALRTSPVALRPGERAPLRFEVTLPATAQNNLAGDYTKLTLYVDAEQQH